MPMNMQQMEGVIRTATTGSKLRLVFKREAVDDVMYLVNAQHAGMVQIDMMTELTLQAIKESHE